jgi:hypothetical protein
MKFFVPQAQPSEYEATYQAICGVVKDQLRTPLSERRIFSLSYTHDKRRFRAEVGQLDPQQGRYEVLAIFESKPHIIFTRAQNGGHGVTILVSSDEVTAVEEFDAVAV